MQIKVNMEIRDIEDEVVLGLTVRKLISTLLILICVVPMYMHLVRILPTDIAAIASLLAGLVIGLIGFRKWHKMPFERAVLYWGYTLLCPKQIVFKGENVYMPEIQMLRKATEAQKNLKKRKETRDAIQKDVLDIEEAPEGISADTEQDAGHDSDTAGV